MYSMGDFVTDVKSIPTALQSHDLVLTHIKYSFLAGLGAFLILFPCYRSRKSFFDAIAARQIIRIARLFIICEFGCVVMLFSYYFRLGSPLALHAGLSYGDGDSWLYGYGRPTSALVFICMLGIVCDMHPILRWIAMAGCLVGIFGDAISAYQVYDYYKQIRDQEAPSNGYSAEHIINYYWRDIISFGLGVDILLLIAYLSNVVGWCPPQLIHPALISGYDMDRYAVMHEQRDRRHVMEQRGFLGPIPAPRRERLTVAGMLKELTSNRQGGEGKDNEGGGEGGGGGGEEADEEQPLIVREAGGSGKDSDRDGGKDDDDEVEDDQEHLL